MVKNHLHSSFVLNAKAKQQGAVGHPFWVSATRSVLIVSAKSNCPYLGVFGLATSSFLFFFSMGMVDPVTLGVPTDAFNFPFKGIIHSVGPRMGDGEELEKLIKTITNSLLIAEKKGWVSIAFPAMGTGIFGIPKVLCA